VVVVQHILHYEHLHRDLSSTSLKLVGATRPKTRKSG